MSPLNNLTYYNKIYQYSIGIYAYINYNLSENVNNQWNGMANGKEKLEVCTLLCKHRNKVWTYNMELIIGHMLWDRKFMLRWYQMCP